MSVTNPYDELGPLNIDPSEFALDDVLPVVEDVIEWLHLLFDLLPAYEQGQVRHYQEMLRHTFGIEDRP